MTQKVYKAPLIETIPRGGLRPGLYVTRTGTAAHAQCHAALLTGEAKFRGEHFDLEGRHVLAVEVGGRQAGRRGLLIEATNPLRANPRVGIGAQFFSTALKTYKNWQEAWWREAIQNSVDAGATEVILSVEERGEHVRVSCEDNGGGMSPEVLFDKFLVLGGSTKGEEGSGSIFRPARILEGQRWPDLWARWEGLRYSNFITDKNVRRFVEDRG